MVIITFHPDSIQNKVLIDKNGIFIYYDKFVSDSSQHYRLYTVYYDKKEKPPFSECLLVGSSYRFYDVIYQLG